MWNDIKRNPDEVKSAIGRLKAVSANRHTRLLTMWNKAPACKNRESDTALPNVQPVADGSRGPSTSAITDVPSTSSGQTLTGNDDDTVGPATDSKYDLKITATDDSSGVHKNDKPLPKPAEDAAQQELQSVNSSLASLYAVKNTGLWTDDMKTRASEQEGNKKKLQKKSSVCNLIESETA